MKGQRFDTGVLMLAVTLILCAFPISAVAQQYLGEFCWEAYESGSPTATGLVRLDVYRQEGGNYSVLGTMEDLAIDVVNVLNGSAAVVPTGPMSVPMVSVTLQGSNPGGFAQVNLLLDLPPTLSGTYSGVLILTQPSLGAQKIGGVITFVTCP